ncbi:MAG TPA: amino acid adenylation domain-containing protein, partial [Bryobacteraceae bacterium]|nr:amino acid adenylation domain-containing protein [Bryobacteraceae bacterium]
MDYSQLWPAKVSPHEQMLLDLQVGEARYSEPHHQTIKSRQDRCSAPLSFAQQRLWFLKLLDPACTAYNKSTSIRLHGDIDREMVKLALSALVERHEILRTNFRTTDEGILVQRINGEQSIDLKIIELAESTREAQEDELQRVIVRFTELPIDLSRDPLLRAVLIRLAENDHALVVITHRIAFDDWSNEILWREFAALYSAFLKGESCPFPVLPIQYADYALWQHRWPQPKILDKQLDYWKKQLDGIPTLQLPTDRPRSSNHSYQGAVRSSFLSKTLSEQLKALSRQEGVTLFVTLLAAFQTLLFRYSGQEDFAVGTPITGRNHAEIQDLIGCFDNKLVLRSDLGGNPTFRELLKRVRELILGACEHHDVPFEKLLQDIKPERNLNQAPLFQVLFALQDVPAQPLKIPGLDVRRGNVDRHIAIYDLSFSLQDEPDGLKQSLVYSTDLFEASTMDRLLAHYEVLLEGVVADPDQRVLQLPILPRAEWHQIGVDWNNTAKPYPGDKCIHSLFEAQAQLTPDAVAVVSEVEQLTYRELDERSNRLARYLRNMRVGADVPVGICVDRSMEMMVGILGILKAGGAYLPLDPAYPTERIRFMLEDTKAPVLLTSHRLAVQSQMSFTNVVCLDTDWAEIAAESGMNLPVEETSDKLAYVNYTSGTTGTPKGVLITHRALVNASLAAVSQYDIKESDRVLQFASPSFDVAAEEMFPTWVAGGVVVMKSNRMLSIAEFVAFLDREMVSVVNIPAPYWHQWVAELECSTMAIPQALRLIVVGSDCVSPEKVRAWHKVVGDDVRLINAYGCTEATITSTIFEATPHRSHQELTPVPIGRPISNTKVYILDATLNPVPIGIPGELHIGGAGVARGYLNNPALTANKFIDDPFAGAEHGRLYKTGDLARYLSDGNIELLGRMDTQVKVRGFRIETEEIEAVLAQHPLVRESVVRAWQDEIIETRLVAYVVLTQPAVSSTDALKAFLREKLPDYMVP